MKALLILLTTLVATLAISPDAFARKWSDKSGKYNVDAQMIAFSDEDVVLQRKDNRLVSVAIADLSEADQKYLKSDEAKKLSSKTVGEAQTWTMRSGLKVPGNVVDYVRKDVTVQRRRGKVYVNDRVFGNLPQVYQRIVPQVIGYFEENKVRDEKTLTSWLVHRKGRPQTYTCEGVVLEVASGDEYGIPFFLFSDKDLELLKPGWEQWSKQNGNYEAQQDSAFHLQSLAAANQKNAETSQQIARMQLMMQSVTAGATSLWEVMLYPVNNAAPPLCVVVPGRDSRQATAAAMQRNPGYRAGPVRKVAGY